MDDYYFMKKALEQAKKALSAGEFPVGCVIAHQNKILVNGSRNGTTGDSANETDHAEMVALRRLTDMGENADRNEFTLFCTMEPCLMCFAAILLSGIGKIVYAYEDVMGGGTQCDLTRLPPLYKNRQISIVPDILREESLELFKAFFANPDNNYWKGSLLAQYTLSQP
ncbi:nucleoside deaminase [Desulfonema magnum]|uniref:CMP/dCMP deaminase zinc-binding domain-containing protein n=1 Tax=Desulfonema magnum TaxID=45655 RepID=A0A975BUE3_9BACT|nr:nucleoside deaminase [Desulfonema magnum]QTA91682.1 CMP/dCMP deaminase zinc-binding domain-containing protein [Desulfonema magnum]